MVDEGISSYYDSNVGLEFIDELTANDLIYVKRIPGGKIVIGHIV